MKERMEDNVWEYMQCHLLIKNHNQSLSKLEIDLNQTSTQGKINLKNSYMAHKLNLLSFSSSSSVVTYISHNLYLHKYGNYIFI
jgi:hypothetical protein